MPIKDLILCFKFIRSRFKAIQVRYLPSKCQQDGVLKKIKGSRQRRSPEFSPKCQKLVSCLLIVLLYGTNYGVKFHKIRHFEMSRRPFTIVIIVYTNVIILVYWKMIMCLYIDNDNITKYNHNVQNLNHDAVIKS